MHNSSRGHFIVFYPGLSKLCPIGKHLVPPGLGQLTKFMPKILSHRVAVRIEELVNHFLKLKILYYCKL